MQGCGWRSEYELLAGGLAQGSRLQRQQVGKEGTRLCILEGIGLQRERQGEWHGILTGQPVRIVLKGKPSPCIQP